MKITIGQLKQLIREQVEEATTGEKTAVERFKSALESDKSGQEDLIVYGELAKAVIDSYNRGATPAKLIRAIKNATKTGEGDDSYDELSDVLKVVQNKDWEIGEKLKKTANIFHFE